MRPAIFLLIGFYDHDVTRAYRFQWIKAQGCIHAQLIQIFGPVPIMRAQTQICTIMIGDVLTHISPTPILELHNNR